MDWYLVGLLILPREKKVLVILGWRYRIFFIFKVKKNDFCVFI